MYVRKITYTDYNGNERTETACFNLNEAELAELNLTTEGGYQEHLRKIMDSKDIPSVVKEFKKIFKMSYGQKSDDGRRFIKSDRLTEEFLQTEAYSQLFIELASNEESITEFVMGVLPEKYRNNIAEARKELLAANNENA